MKRTAHQSKRTIVPWRFNRNQTDGINVCIRNDLVVHYCTKLNVKQRGTIIVRSVLISTKKCQVIFGLRLCIITVIVAISACIFFWLSCFRKFIIGNMCSQIALCITRKNMLNWKIKFVTRNLGLLRLFLIWKPQFFILHLEKFSVISPVNTMDKKIVCYS